MPQIGWHLGLIWALAGRLGASGGMPMLAEPVKATQGQTPAQSHDK